MQKDTLKKFPPKPEFPPSVRVEEGKENVGKERVFNLKPKGKSEMLIKISNVLSTALFDLCLLAMCLGVIWIVKILAKAIFNF